MKNFEEFMHPFPCCAFFLGCVLVPEYIFENKKGKKVRLLSLSLVPDLRT